MQIYKDLKAKDPDKWDTKEFKASVGWMNRFLKRKRITYKKRKCGKEKTASECIPELKKFIAVLRFELLKPKDDDVDPADPLWGRFPPNRRYNMDQVPLPFVCGQDHTFTPEEDKDVNIKYPGEQFRKRQFTMHVVTNAGDKNNKHGWCDLVCRGAGLRISQAENVEICKQEKKSVQ